MNKAFVGALQHYAQAKPSLSHSYVVMRLYRASLRALNVRYF